MSRIGNKIINMPNGVSATIEGNIIKVNGPKGSLAQDYDNKNIGVKIDANTITVTRNNEENEVKAKHGLYRALINNMVVGVSEGFTKSLLIAGVGYKANANGNKLVLNLGLSHPVELVVPEGLKVECPTATEIKVSGIDKQAVGQFASVIRDLRPVEPYHAYGIRYSDEVVVRKVGKTAGKGKK